MKGSRVTPHSKAELASGLKKFIVCGIPSILPPAVHERALVIDSMAYARNVPIKKLNLKTYRDLFNHLWNTFKSLSESCSRTDIVFDLYKEMSIKTSERNCRAKVEGILTYISSIDQQLPIDIDKFWPVSKNKIAFQRFFIQWMTTEYNDAKHIFFRWFSHRG